MKQLRKNSGFSLVEVLVAMAVMTAAFSVLFRIMSTTNSSVRAASDYRIALAYAESKMAELTADNDFGYGQRAGLTGDIEWRQSVTDASGIRQQQGQAYQVRRLAVDVIVHSGDAQRTVSLTTLRYRHEDG